MIVYRIANKLYSGDLSGTGARLYGARWNSKGIPMLYTSAYISLALVEMLVHTQFNDYATDLSLMHIYFPDNSILAELDPAKMKTNWIEDEGYSRFIGDEFIQSKQSLLLKVPSAVVQEEHNFLINPLHEGFKNVSISKIKMFRPDKRFFSI